MSSLTDVEKRYFEKILNMESGFVLDYSDPKFGEFFNRHSVPIHSSKYQTYGPSKAKKMRAFWEQEDDKLVATVLSEMLDSYQADCDLSDREADIKLLERCRNIVSRLSGNRSKDAATDQASILNQEFTIPNVHKLPVESQVGSIVEKRISEARVALGAKAYLSTIFLCGSVLEGVLLGAAQRMPKEFNSSSSSPRDANGRPKPFHEWSLAQLIDTACDIRLLDVDVKKFSHALRDFRNYIHPYEQMRTGFTPDEHTAKVCFQVLKAALANLAGDRR